MAQSVTTRHRNAWQRTTRAIRRYREVILIVLTLAMSLAFLFYGYIAALMLETQHAGWFGHGY